MFTKKSIYKVHIKGIMQDYKFNCISVKYINKHLKYFIRLHGYRLNITVRNYYTNEIIQYSSIHPDLFVFNGLDNKLKLIKRKNSFYFKKS